MGPAIWLTRRRIDSSEKISAPPPAPKHLFKEVATTIFGCLGITESA
jgi:hypothetical protein